MVASRKIHKQPEQRPVSGSQQNVEGKLHDHVVAVAVAVAAVHRANYVAMR